MTPTIVVMIVIGLVFIIASFFVSEKLSKKVTDANIDLLTVKDDYEFSDRELQIIKRKIEDVIAKQAKDILYETNDSLSTMANEKTMALGDYAVTVCDEIEKNHKEVMFLYSMLDDKQKEIMNTVQQIDNIKSELTELLKQCKEIVEHTEDKLQPEKKEEYPKNSALEQLTALKNTANDIKNEEITQESKAENDVNNDKTDAEIKTESTKNQETDAESESDLPEEDIFTEIDHTDIDFNDVLEDEFKDNENSNEIILEMYRNGSSILEIAKQLGLGVGEVRLVIDLYQGENK